MRSNTKEKKLMLNTELKSATVFNYDSINKTIITIIQY